MAEQTLQIRAKKISELDNFLDSHLTPDENSYIIIGYNNGSIKQNYKMTLSSLLSLVSDNNPGGSGIIDEQVLETKIREYVNNNINILRGYQGPQGAQGAQGNGADINLDDIQQQIDNLQELVNRYHNTYTISYNLTNIRSNSSNPSYVMNNESTTVLYFTPNDGFEMPNSVNVEGDCDSSYNKNTKSISISNVRSNIQINMSTNILKEYTISYNFTNITYNVVQNNQSSYVINNFIVLELTADTNYKLPMTLNYSNCNIVYSRNNDTHAMLNITCNGKGNMSIIGVAESNIDYYFGIISNNPDNYDKVNITYEYYRDGSIKNILNVNIIDYSWLTTSKSCPFTINEQIYVSNVGRGYNSIIIVPAKYYNVSTYQFKNDLNITGYIHDSSSNSQLRSDEYCEFYINDILYYAINWGEGLTDNSILIIN